MRAASELSWVPVAVEGVRTMPETLTKKLRIEIILSGDVQEQWVRRFGQLKITYNGNPVIVHESGIFYAVASALPEHVARVESDIRKLVDDTNRNFQHHDL